MKLDRRELKRAAKEAISQADPKPMHLTIIYLLIIYGVNIMVSLMSTLGVSGGRGSTATFHTLNLFLNILVSLFFAVMQFGYSAYGLRVADGEGSCWRNLFCGFPQTGRVIPMSLAIDGFYILWFMAVIVPALILLFFLAMIVAWFGAIGIGFSMAFTQATGEIPIGAVTGLGISVILVVLAVYLAAVGFFCFLLVRYALSSFCLADDQGIGPLNAIRRSRVLLRGHNWECFKLQLSFIGWELLALLCSAAVVAVWWLIFGMESAMSVGVSVSVLAMIPLMLWLQPYMTVTMAKYYRRLSPRAQAQEAAQPESYELPEPETPWRPGEK